MRGARQDNATTKAQHVLSASAHESGLVIGQRCAGGKGNEITALPHLVETLAIEEGTIVAIDAMGTQKAAPQAILNKNAGYVLALKGNQSTLHRDTRLFFADNKLAEIVMSTQLQILGTDGLKSGLAAQRTILLGSKSGTPAGRACTA